MQVADEFVERHRIHGQPIGFPIVTRGTKRLGLAATPFHRNEDVEYLVTSLKEVC